MSDTAALLAARSQLLQEIAQLTADLQNNRQKLQTLEAEFLGGQRDSSTIGAILALRTTIARQTAELARLTQELADIDLLLVNAREQDQPRTSAGDTVVQAQRANDEGANAVSPQEDPPPPLPPTNADRFQEDGEDINTNADSRPSVITQSLPPITAIPGAAAQFPGQQPASIQPQLDPFDISGIVADDKVSVNTTFRGGVGQPREDATGGSNVVGRINSLFGGEAGRILPKPNALDAYASYTYNISMYLLSPDDYKLMLTKKILPKSWQLLMQSAGAPVGGGVIPASQLDPNIETSQAAGEAQLANLGRNQFFPLDYYIDDVVIQHLLPNRGTGGPHNSTRLQFKIFEPNGITFLPNLYAAVQQYVALRGGQASVQNQVYTSQNFLMVIRFYGYDQNGNLVTAGNDLNQIASTDGTILQRSSKATIEKFIPFQFTEVKFRIQNKITEYECSAVCPQNMINTGSTRGRIPYNIELTSQSLRDLLTGPTNFVGGTRSAGAAGQVVDTGDDAARLLARYPGPGASANTRYNPRTAQLQRSAPTTATQRGPNSDADAQIGGFYGSPSPNASPGPAKADAASQARKLTISQGLQEALNKFQAEISGPGPDFPQEYPDIYEIEIAEEVIANAKIVPPGQFNPRQSGMIKAQTAKEATDGETQSVDTNSKSNSIAAGLSIVQAIDQAVRQSSYVLDQQLYYIDSVTGKTVDQGNAAQAVGWFRIGLEAEPTGQYDTKRNDYAYRIKYSVAAYQVNDIKSDYFPRTAFQGTHKIYPYWFTGENTQILSFEQSFNSLYYITQNAKARPKRTSNYLEADRYYFQTLTSESSQGQDNMKVYDGAASAASWLYSPGDQAEVKMTIVGDPAWIFQGEVWSGIQDLNTNYSAFLADGTINPTGREILFEVVFNEPIDYDLNTGLMDGGQFNFGTNQAFRAAGLPGTSPAGLPRLRYIYHARTCTSTFRQGRFTQELNGLIKTFPLEDPIAENRARQQEQAQTQKAAIAAQSNTRTSINQGQASTVAQASQAARVFAATTPLTSDSQRLQGYSPTLSAAAPDILPLQPATAPTSSTQLVGPAAAAQEAIRTLGGAAGPAVGPPTTVLYLNDGQAVEVSSIQEIDEYASVSSAAAQLAAANRLNRAQQAAADAIRSSPQQVGVRET